MRKKISKFWGKIRKIDQNLRKNEESGTLAHPGLWGCLRPWVTHPPLGFTTNEHLPIVSNKFYHPVYKEDTCCGSICQLYNCHQAILLKNLPSFKMYRSTFLQLVKYNHDVIWKWYDVHHVLNLPILLKICVRKFQDPFSWSKVSWCDFVNVMNKTHLQPVWHF